MVTILFIIVFNQLIQILTLQSKAYLITDAYLITQKENPTGKMLVLYILVDTQVNFFTYLELISAPAFRRILMMFT